MQLISHSSIHYTYFQFSSNLYNMNLYRIWTFNIFYLTLKTQKSDFFSLEKLHKGYTFKVNQTFGPDVKTNNNYKKNKIFIFIYLIFPSIYYVSLRVV